MPTPLILSYIHLRFLAVIFLDMHDLPGIGPMFYVSNPYTKFPGFREGIDDSARAYLSSEKILMKIGEARYALAEPYATLFQIIKAPQYRGYVLARAPEQTHTEQPRLTFYAFGKAGIAEYYEVNPEANGVEHEFAFTLYTDAQAVRERLLQIVSLDATIPPGPGQKMLFTDDLSKHTADEKGQSQWMHTQFSAVVKGELAREYPADVSQAIEEAYINNLELVFLTLYRGTTLSDQDGKTHGILQGRLGGYHFFQNLDDKALKREITLEPIGVEAAREIVMQVFNEALAIVAAE